MIATETKLQTTGRPKKGYYNAAGKRIPGCTTIIGRFKESAALIQWAWKMGRDGMDLDKARDAAFSAGTACHDMIYAHTHGKEFDRAPYTKDVLAQADHAFLGFLEWASQNSLRLEAAEVALISEQHQFGGTFDAAMVGDSLRLLDYKTSSAIYNDALIQVAGGYSLLWEENFPDKPLGGVDILRVSKPEAPSDPVSFSHCHWSAEIFPVAQEQFLLFRRAYDLDKRLKSFL